MKSTPFFLTAMLASALTGAVAFAAEPPRPVAMTSVIEDALSRHSGSFLAQAELDDERGGLVYEVEVAWNDGRSFDLTYDAYTGEWQREHEDYEDDYDGAGNVSSFASLLAAVEAQQPGELREVELDDERGRWVYEVKVKSADGRSREIHIDAESRESLAHDDD